MGRAAAECETWKEPSLKMVPEEVKKKKKRKLCTKLLFSVLHLSKTRSEKVFKKLLHYKSVETLLH